MKLKDFIKDLEEILSKIDRPDKVEVEMADCIPVVRPIFKDGTVFITDIDPDAQED
jgi:hypothetical protein